MFNLVLVLSWVRTFAVAAIIIAAVSLIASPAFAWYWPIFGFSSGWGMPSTGIGGATTILPGTPEWGLQPDLGAHLVPFGYPYGQIQGSIDFGFAPFITPCCGGLGFGGAGIIG